MGVWKTGSYKAPKFLFLQSKPLQWVCWFGFLKKPSNSGFHAKCKWGGCSDLHICTWIQPSGKKEKGKIYWRHWKEKKIKSVRGKGFNTFTCYLALTKSSNPRWPPGSCLHPSSWPLFNVLAKVADIRNTMPSSCFVCRYVIEISWVVVGSCYA